MWGNQGELVRELCDGNDDAIVGLDCIGVLNHSWPPKIAAMIAGYISHMVEKGVGHYPYSYG